MARPLRIEFPGAVYHVMSRGNNRAAVFNDDADRTAFLRQLDRTSLRLGWRILSYCLMNNHYHLVVETPEPTLAHGMLELNSSYAQHFNRRHERVGHLFQGRYHAILVQRGSYLLELARYVVLNPVRAGLCSRPDAWPWSSYRAVVAKGTALAALDCQRLLAPFAGLTGDGRWAYEQFVLAGIGLPAPKSDDVRKQTAPVYGGQAFRNLVLGDSADASPEIPRGQRAVRELTQYQAQSQIRDDAIRAARASGHYSLIAIGRHFGLHYSTVSKICRESRPPGANEEEQ